MAISTEPYKGTRDFYPKDMQFRNWMFGKLSEVARSFGYLEYGGPMIESFDLYAAKSGEELVSQQLYHFVDRGDRKVAVRPEMTPTMARLVAARIHELPGPSGFSAFRISGVMSGRKRASSRALAAQCGRLGRRCAFGRNRIAHSRG